MLIQADLDALWDFADAAGSEARLRAAAAAASSTERAELETQVARAVGLQERFAEAEMILEAIGDQAPAVRVRVALERGRVRNSSDDPAAATPLLREAASLAGSAGLTFLRVDALHMLAIADADHAEAWTREALAVLDGVDDPRTQRWAVALHSNAGWAHFDAGRFVDALSEFLKAKDAAVRWGTPQQVRFADDALEECRTAIASPGR
jgi:hypothetical protein